MNPVPYFVSVTWNFMNPVPYFVSVPSEFYESGTLFCIGTLAYDCKSGPAFRTGEDFCFNFLRGYRSIIFLFGSEVLASFLGTNPTKPLA